MAFYPTGDSELIAVVERVNEQLRSLPKVVESPRALEFVAQSLQVPSQRVRSQWEWLESLEDSLDYWIHGLWRTMPGSPVKPPDLSNSELEALVEMGEAVRVELRRMGPDPTPERRQLHSVRVPDAASLAGAFRHSIWLPDHWPTEAGSVTFEALIETGPRGIEQELIAAGEPKAYESRAIGSIDLTGRWGTTLDSFALKDVPLFKQLVQDAVFPTLQWVDHFSECGVVVLVPKLVVSMRQRGDDPSELIEMACSLREIVPVPEGEQRGAGTTLLRRRTGPRPHRRS